jgi:hypothetical protein
VTEGGVRKVVVAVDPAKEPAGPLRLGRQLARALRSPVVLVTVLPHHPLMEGPEDELQRAARDEARENLLEIGQSLEGVHVADALAITGTSPAGRCSTSAREPMRRSSWSARPPVGHCGGSCRAVSRSGW